jgi:hypothetical protein
MKVNLNLKTSSIFALFSIFLISQQALGQERRVEESLIYSDPTVAKSDTWSGGIFLDAFHNQLKTKVYDTNGSPHDASNTNTRIGFSGYFGKGDTTYLFSYRPAEGKMTVPPGGGMINEDRVELKTDIYEFNVRYMDRANSTWFVPYYLAGVAILDNQWTVPTVVINGVTEQQTTKGVLMVAGAGAIVPVSSKYGYRFEARLGVGPVRQRSNVFSQWNKNETGGFVRPTATYYYNLSKDVNFQLGAQYDSLLRGAGVFVQLGTKF